MNIHVIYEIHQFIDSTLYYIFIENITRDDNSKLTYTVLNLIKRNQLQLLLLNIRKKENNLNTVEVETTFTAPEKFCPLLRKLSNGKPSNKCKTSHPKSL